VRGIEGLTNPRGFILADKHQRNPTFPDVFSVGVCVAIPPVGKTPVPVGVPKTGFMIESMVTATATTSAALLPARPSHGGADLERGLPRRFRRRRRRLRRPAADPAAQRQLVVGSGKWVHAAKVGFEKYFLTRSAAQSEPFYEKLALQPLGIDKLLLQSAFTGFCPAASVLRKARRQAGLRLLNTRTQAGTMVCPDAPRPPPLRALS
jgi:sulfide:quinone oxidoreductase